MPQELAELAISAWRAQEDERAASAEQYRARQIERTRDHAAAVIVGLTGSHGAADETVHGFEYLSEVGQTLALAEVAGVKLEIRHSDHVSSLARAVVTCPICGEEARSQAEVRTLADIGRILAAEADPILLERHGQHCNGVDRPVEPTPPRPRYISRLVGTGVRIDDVLNEMYAAGYDPLILNPAVIVGTDTGRPRPHIDPDDEPF